MKLPVMQLSPFSRYFISLRHLSLYHAYLYVFLSSRQLLPLSHWLRPKSRDWSHKSLWGPDAARGPQVADPRHNQVKLNLYAVLVS
jgi:hypothetical protein